MKIIRPTGATIEFTEEEKTAFTEAGKILYNLITYSMPSDLVALASKDGTVSTYEVRKISNFLLGLANGDYSLK